MATLYVPDQIDGEDLQWTIYPGGTGNAPSAVPIGGLQTLHFNHDYPARIATEAGPNRKKRFQPTDTDSVTWNGSMFVIYKDSFADVLAMTGNPAIDYGSIEWDRFVFDFTVDYMMTDDQGNVIRSGGWIVRNARLTSFAIDMAAPYDIIMQNVSGIAMGSSPKAWA